MEAKIAKVTAKDVGGGRETECIDGLAGALVGARMNWYLVEYLCSEFSDVLWYIKRPRSNI